ncbi:MAG: bifunctional (p)ppGpp synthetase/guanosine-3',5'-bis(diphosphate) 3'-pyrophosphohydrolase [Synergistaceae bacterium]
MNSDGIENITTNVRVAHLSEISKNSSCCVTRGELKSLMEGYWGRIATDQRVPSLRLAWQDLWEKSASYLSKEDMKSIGEAFVFASECHCEQRRYTGEPYVIHTVSVAAILARMQMDKETIIAALLHDVLEDTPVEEATIVQKYGESVLTLVDGVTKLGKLPFKSVEDYQAENLRKMFVVMAKDIRVVLIKLADRLHNMRTISSHRREKQVRIAHETLEIYAPLAHRLGIYQVKRDLEDLSFRILDPEMYYDIKRRVRKKLPEREMIIKDAMDILSERVTELGLHASIKGRPKHFYSIYEKMKRKHLSLEQLYDLLALRVVVDSLEECYQILGLVHTIWKPIPGQFDDYIANPKSNMYQSLHTTVVGPSGEPLEVQIRTQEMNSLAEYGIAAHWNYKEGGSSKINNLDKGLTWIRQAIEEGVPDTPEEGESKGSLFLDNLKTDVLSSDVFVFTPKGEVISIPNGSIPIDFAYAIHTEVGNKCVGAMVNGIIAPMDQVLHNGDIVRVLTSPQAKPSRDWIKIAKSSRTKQKIKAWFRQQDRQEREDKIKRGKELLEKEALRRNPEMENPLTTLSSQISHIAREMGYLNTEDLIVSVGTGNHTASNVLSRLNNIQQNKSIVDQIPDKPPVQQRKESEAEIIVEGANGVLVSIAQCCYPVPGDSITGRVTQVHGISVHRADCQNLRNAESSKKINVSWGNKSAKSRYTARLKIEGVDKATLFSDVVQAITAMDALITSIKAKVVNNSRTRVIAEIKVKDLEHLYRVVARLNTVSGIIEVIRG